MINNPREVTDKLYTIKENAEKYSTLLCDAGNSLNAWRSCNVLRSYAIAVSDLFELFTGAVVLYLDNRVFFEREFVPEKIEEEQMRDEQLLRNNKRINEIKRKFINLISFYKDISGIGCDGNKVVIEECQSFCKVIDDIVEFVENNTTFK